MNAKTFNMTKEENLLYVDNISDESRLILREGGEKFIFKLKK